MSSEERWAAVSNALMAELGRHKSAPGGESYKTTEYIHTLTQMDIPSEVKGLKCHNGLQMGIIDVVVTFGEGSKFGPDSPYLSEPGPMRLMTPSQHPPGYRRAMPKVDTPRIEEVAPRTEQIAPQAEEVAPRAKEAAPDVPTTTGKTIIDEVSVTRSARSYGLPKTTPVVRPRKAKKYHSTSYLQRYIENCDSPLREEALEALRSEPSSQGSQQSQQKQQKQQDQQKQQIQQSQQKGQTVDDPIDLDADDPTAICEERRLPEGSPSASRESEARQSVARGSEAIQSVARDSEARQSETSESEIRQSEARQSEDVEFPNQAIGIAEEFLVEDTAGRATEDQGPRSGNTLSWWVDDMLNAVGETTNTYHEKLNTPASSDALTLQAHQIWPLPDHASNNALTHIPQQSISGTNHHALEIDSQHLDATEALPSMQPAMQDPLLPSSVIDGSPEADLQRQHIINPLLPTQFTERESLLPALPTEEALEAGFEPHNAREPLLPTPFTQQQSLLSASAIEEIPRSHLPSQSLESLERTTSRDSQHHDIGAASLIIISDDSSLSSPPTSTQASVQRTPSAARWVKLKIPAARSDKVTTRSARQRLRQTQDFDGATDTGPSTPTPDGTRGRQTQDSDGAFNAETSTATSDRSGIRQTQGFEETSDVETTTGRPGISRVRPGLGFDGAFDPEPWIESPDTPFDENLESGLQQGDTQPVSYPDQGSGYQGSEHQGSGYQGHSTPSLARRTSLLSGTQIPDADTPAAPARASASSWFRTPSAFASVPISRPIYRSYETSDTPEADYTASAYRCYETSDIPEADNTASTYPAVDLRSFSTPQTYSTTPEFRPTTRSLTGSGRPKERSMERPSGPPLSYEKNMPALLTRTLSASKSGYPVLNKEAAQTPNLTGVPPFKNDRKRPSAAQDFINGEPVKKFKAGGGFLMSGGSASQSPGGGSTRKRNSGEDYLMTKGSASESPGGHSTRKRKSGGDIFGTKETAKELSAGGKATNRKTSGEFAIPGAPASETIIIDHGFDADFKPGELDENCIIGFAKPGIVRNCHTRRGGWFKEKGVLMGTRFLLT